MIFATEDFAGKGVAPAKPLIWLRLAAADGPAARAVELPEPLVPDGHSSLESDRRRLPI